MLYLIKAGIVIWEMAGSEYFLYFQKRENEEGRQGRWRGRKRTARSWPEHKEEFETEKVKPKKNAGEASKSAKLHNLSLSLL
jgi:hypothetical protein